MSLTNIELVGMLAPCDADDSPGFARGFRCGLACVVPIWGVIIAAVWLAL
jgi:hypothetical protein